MATNNTFDTITFEALNNQGATATVTINPYYVQAILPEGDGSVVVIGEKLSFNVNTPYEKAVKIWKDAMKHNLNRFGAYRE